MRTVFNIVFRIVSTLLGLLMIAMGTVWILQASRIAFLRGDRAAIRLSNGVDWVLVLMVRRENVASGETTIYDLVKRPLGSFTLTAPLDSALVDDSRVYHGVTPVAPLDPRRPAYRDVLVVTFRRE